VKQGFCFAASGVASLEFEFGGGGEKMRKSGRVKLVPFADIVDAVDVVVSAVEAVVGFVVVVGVLVIAVFLAMPLKCGKRQAQ
jgi:hypothetical protein